MPDVLMYNSADDSFDSTYQTNVIVYNDGSTSYIPPGMFRSTCKIDITWFPFDKQECIMKFGSWTYDGTKLDLRLKSDSADLASYTPNGEWDLLGVPAKRNVELYTCCPEPYIDIKFKITLRRRMLYFIINLIAPTLLIISMVMLLFLMPVCTGEKILLDSIQGNHEKRLLNTLLDGYQTLERPVLHESDPVVVTLGLSLQDLIDVDEKNQIVTSNCWLDMGWTDASLRWEPAEYGNVTSVRIHPSNLWMPDVLMYNSADDNFDSTYQTNVIVNHDGTTSYIPPGMFRSTCKIDITWFPFDKQECIMKFGSWTYDGTKLDLRLKADRADLAKYTINGEWDLLDMPAHRNVEFYDCCPNAPYIDLKFKFILMRRKLYYLVNLIIPAVLLSGMTLLTFTIPPDAGEKISFGVTILLAYTVFMMVVSDSLPSTSDAVPLLSIYFGAVVLLCALTVVFAIFVLNFHHRNSSTHDMPRWVKQGVCNWLAWVVCMKRPGHDSHLKGTGKNRRKDRQRKVLLVDNTKKLTFVTEADENGDLFNDSDNMYDQNHSSEQQTAQMSCELRAILRELQIITGRLRETDESDAISDDWKWAAMVIDRFLLIMFSLLTVASTVGLLCSCPTLYL